MRAALATLRGDARRLWTDEGERRAALRAVVDAAGDARRLASATGRVDRAVTDLLRALGLPRGPILRVSMEEGLAPYGQKDPDCALRLSLDHLADLLALPGGPDSALRTWVHESIHARRPYTAGHRMEYRQWRGYEEGLAEGLARAAVIGAANLHPAVTGYEYYVAAYRTLARAAEIDVEQLWRRLWDAPTGEVRGRLLGALDAERRGAGRTSLTDTQRRRVRGFADQLFGSGRVHVRPDDAAMMKLWEIAFR